MRVVHLTASNFFGGPERQMLGLAEALRGYCDSAFLSFAERGRCSAFILEARRRGFVADPLAHDTPRLVAATGELASWLTELKADILLTHGYKSNLIGRWAARKVNLPCAAVSRGWTAESAKIRMYEKLDRIVLRGMDAVVCVSQGQAAKVLGAGVAPEKIQVIRNAARTGDFPPPTPLGRADLLSLAATPGEFVIVTPARLSPEKGVSVLLSAARRVLMRHPGTRFIIFGEGAERESLERRIASDDLGHAVSLAGFHTDLDRLLPNADLLVLPSFTEGLPNVVLEAAAAGVPVVATAVGGTPEAVDHKSTGLLVPPGDSEALAVAVAELLAAPATRREMGRAAQLLVRNKFSFASQANEYVQLFAKLGVAPALARQSVAA